ncbi:hypothetical protein PVAND_011620 [Polypedilum vanderplanki]|uniref:Uncharacterized protein n=1 Tax=Polypedilum vanderplanki TaxID=319348 RepID=A0A9J6CK11_POLVA|nr:hypothetical protein PVAND_011620 [Polypedilum vanderplanki]
MVKTIFILLCAFIDEHTCDDEIETSISRSLDLSIPAWRPLVQNPYHHQYYHHLLQNNVPNAAHLISYAHLNPVNKDEIIEAAKYNAQTLKKYNELSQQPITSYSNPYPYFTQTPGPLVKTISTTTFLNPNLVRQQQQPHAAASNLIHARLPYPGKSATLYSTKLNYLGKPELSVSLHQNSIHQTVATTPKIAGFTKEQNGRVNFHYHHPSFGMVPSYDTTTKRNPIFSSSVTPQSTTKVHPVMSKLQAHMALAAISQQNHHNKLKHAVRHNIAVGGSSNEFSPPSQIVSNYANYESATRVPLWHHGSPVKSNNLPQHHAHNHNNAEYHHHFHKPDAQTQQQVLPSVHPSIITPFLEQVHLKQKEVAAAEQKQSFKQSHESNSNENFSSNGGSFDIVNDVFSKHLVPPPPSSTSSKAHYKKPDKAKFNLSMKSPLQDASRFNYNNVISTATPSTPTASNAPSTKISNVNDVSNYRPALFSSENSHTSYEDKPNLFANLNRSKENPYKQHKLLHPAYSGNGLKKKPSLNHDKTFLPTPYIPSEEEKDDEIKIDFEPHHSYFTIEDAVTPHFPESMKYDNHGGSDELEIITLRPPQIKPTKDYFGITTAPSSTTAFIEQQQTPSTIESSSTKPRQKLRRRKPKPQTSASPITTITTTTIEQEKMLQQNQQKINEEQTNVKFIRTRGDSRNNNSIIISHENDLKNKNRLNGNNRLRTRPTLTTPIDYDYTVKTFDDELRRSEVSTTQVTTEGTTSIKASAEISEVPDIVRHRVRLRYKNKLNANAKAGNSLEGIDFKSKLTDSQISDSENENVLVRQPIPKSGSDDEETTELNLLVTENPFNEIKSSLKLPNLKLRNEATFTTLLPTAETIHSSSSMPTSTAVTAENDENIFSQNKIANRPRFSIKELKRKQYLTSSTSVASSTTILTSSTSSTTQKPDTQRFNRFRLNLNRRRNETTTTTISDSNEETELSRKRYSSTRFSTQPASSFPTTESTIQSTKRSILPKRTFLARNFTKPFAIDSNTVIDTTSPKPITTKSTTISTNRHNLRQRIQNYKKKDTSNEIAFPTADDSIKNVNFETTFTHEPSVSTITNSGTTTTTEIPTRETSIMKIAKTHAIKTTTSNNNLITEDDTPFTNNNNDSTDLIGSPSDYSQRVAELTISGNENSTFKSANIGLLSRRIPNYFTISTDDPILPIMAFFPQIKTNENN